MLLARGTRGASWGTRVLLTFVAVLTILALAAPSAEAARRRRVGPFRGVGTWVDIFDDAGWRNPEATVAAMRARGVRTLYLQTCNFRCGGDVFRADRVARWIDAARANRMRIVAWYLPGFDNLRRDFRRSMKAIRFRTANGHRFNGFGLDIESRIVTNVSLRNRRVVRLSRRIRETAGRRYPLGAITPPWFYQWGGPFPYRQLDRYYDAFVPMIYFTVRSNGAAGARRHTARNIDVIRNGTGRPRTAIHAIGGLAADMSAREAGAFVRTAKRKNAIGVSLYDYFTTRRQHWPKLAQF